MNEAQRKAQEHLDRIAGSLIRLDEKWQQAKAENKSRQNWVGVGDLGHVAEMLAEIEMFWRK